MSRYIVYLLVAFVMFSSTLVQAAERKFTVSNFDTIRISGGIDIDITTGKGASAKAVADSQRVLDRLLLRRNGNELVVSVRQKTDKRDRFSVEDKIQLSLSTFALRNITHLGSGQINLDQLKGRTMKARIGGFGSMVVADVEGDAVEVNMTGGGALRITGEVDEAKLSLLGASSFDGEALTVEKLNLTQRGPVRSTIAVEREAEIFNTGSGKIDILGKPNCLVRSAGAAEISCNPKR